MPEPVKVIRVESLDTAITAAMDAESRVHTVLSDTVKATEELRATAGTYNLGRAPRAGDPAGTYRVVTATGPVDVAWNGQAETARTAVLQPANKIAQRTFTPEEFGAKGDGVTSDHAAFFALNAAVKAAGGGRVLLSQPYLLGRYTSGDPQQAGFLDFQRIAGLNLTIEFSGQGELLIDNLNSDGHGDQYGGIVVRGGAEYIEIIRPRVRWVHQPTARTSGYGVLVKGYPDEAHADYIKRCIIRDPEVASAPQGGIIVMGVDNLLVTNARPTNTMADGLHLNANRNPVVVGPVRAINIGDDALALVTYAGTETRPLGPDEGYADSAHLFTPFQTTQDSPWANGNVQADGAWRIGGTGHAARCNGVNGGYIGSLIAENSQRALILDGTKRDGTPSKLWNAGVNRGLKIGAVISRNSGQALAATADGVRGQDDAMFFNQDVEIGSIQASGTGAEDAISINGANGIRIGAVQVDKDVRITGGSVGTKIDRMKARSVIFDAQSDSVVGFIEAQRIDLFSGARASGNLWRSQYAPGQALRLINNGSLKLARLEVDHPNRDNGGANQMLLLAPGIDITIGQISVVQDDHSAVLAEIGGGGPDAVSNNVDLGRIEYLSTAAAPMPPIVVQFGDYAARNVRYSVRASNDKGKTWVEKSLDNSKVSIQFPWQKARVAGDSFTEDPDGYAGQLPAFIGRPVENLGISGQTSAEVAARLGGIQVKFTRPDGGIIPGNGGGVGVNLVSGPDLLRGAGTRSLHGKLGNIPGWLVRSGPNDYGFYADPGGVDQPLPDASVFTPDLNRQQITVIRVGQNDPDKTQTRANVEAIINTLQYPYHFLIIGILHQQDEPNGSAGANAKDAANAQLKQLAQDRGGLYVDPNPLLAVNDDGSARADGTPNPKLMRDNVHENTAGGNLVARKAGALIKAAGW